MRLSPWIMLGVLVTVRSVNGQSYPADMIITLPEVEVRSGPTMQYYATGKLKYGDKILVLHESEQQKGWLAIKPPKGSFSWIDSRFIKQIDAETGVVINAGGAHVLTGSAVSGNAPNVSPPLTIPLGSIVTILDKGKLSDGLTWLPIQPWHTDVRFIPGNAVQTRQLAVNNSTNNSVAPNTWNPAQAPGHPAQMAQSGRWTVGQTASLTRPAPVAQQSLVYPARWSQVGILRRAQFDMDGQPTYYLEGKGNVLLYATCQPGTTLRDFVGRTVALYGTTTYRSNEYMRTHVMTASLVATY